MTASRDIQTTRSNRNSLGMPSSSLPSRNSYSGKYSTSVTLGSNNTGNRVSRRKSSTVTPISMAALTAIRNQAAQGVSSENARLSTSVDRKSPLMAANSEAIEDETSSKIVKSRGRRVSDAPKLTKERTKSNAGELRCDTCGKAYKHGSCLTKHLWEHTPEWQVTSKLLISKHQQVQLLEAASVLVQMNKDIGVASVDDSETSSASPAASGSSNALEDDSDDDRSSRTSTPEQIEYVKPASFGQRLRSDSYNSAYVGSYQSTLATSVAASSVPTYGGFAMDRQWSASSRPSTGQSEDESDLTAAARGLQLIGTPQTMPMVPETDIPPVPALPAQYKEHINVDVEMDEEDDGVFGTMDQ